MERSSTLMWAMVYCSNNQEFTSVMVRLALLVYGAEGRQDIDCVRMLADFIGFADPQAVKKKLELLIKINVRTWR